MRILIADDTAPVRSAIRRLLKEEPDLEIIGEAANLGELVNLTRDNQPDIILLDWELSGLPGSTKPRFEADVSLHKADQRRNVILASLKKYPSHPAIIVLSSLPEAEERSRKAGVDAFVFKGDPPEGLLGAIRDICTGN